MYKQLKKQIDDKEIIQIQIKGLKERISYKLQKQLGLKVTDYSSAKLEIIGITKNDKFIRAFASVEKLDNDLNDLIEEKKIIESTIDEVVKSIDSMNDAEKSVFKCRHILGLTNESTAQRLNYSIQHIKRINSEISKKM